MGEATSTYTIRALLRAIKYLQPRQTMLLRGPHGIGKSAIAYKAAKEWGLKKVIERRISQLSEGDMIGLPDRGAVKVFDGQEWQVTKFLPTDWFLEAEFEPCLVFLDEINRGTPETMQACFQFIEKGELNGRKIHPGSRIIAAVNFSKEYNVANMDPAFLDRFWVVDLAPDKQDWLDWARMSIELGGGGINQDIIDFVVQCNEGHFEIKPEKIAQLPATEVTPSRRSWERLDRHLTFEVGGSKLIDTPNDPVFYDLCRGFIGPDAARALSKFIVDRNQNLTPEDILDRYDSVADRVKRIKPEQAVALLDKIKHYTVGNKVKFTDEQAQNLSKLMKVLPPEIGMQMWNIISETEFDNVVKFHKYCAKYFVKILGETKVGAALQNINK